MVALGAICLDSHSASTSARRPIDLAVEARVEATVRVMREGANQGCASAWEQLSLRECGVGQGGYNMCVPVVGLVVMLLVGW